jgi:hypothetical protein
MHDAPMQVNAYNQSAIIHMGPVAYPLPGGGIGQTTKEAKMTGAWWLYLIWVLAAALLGFVLTAVNQGPETTVQLPPHYSGQIQQAGN